MYLSIIFLPLISFIVCSFFGRFIGHKGSKLIPISFMAVTFSLVLFIFLDVMVSDNLVLIRLNNWFSLGSVNCDFSFQFDFIVNSMLVLVTLVSLLVHLFSSSYMDGDPHITRFMGYLSLFTFFMIILVTSGNIVQVFIGWEGVGLCSYLLISYWFTRIEANKSAIKAMLMNKIGDISFLLGLVLVWQLTGSWYYSSLFSLNDYIELNLMVPCLLFLISVVGKSAQVGLHSWLPDAMEGPTPVSALIHAATMVTAGVFLLIRLSPLFEKLPTLLLAIIFLGSLTTFFSGVIGLFQNDLKKVVAYSTCSQLGYMVLICGLSYYSLSLFHLVSHGVFKALLFLSSGSIIYALIDEQDSRKIGSIIKYLPITYICLIIASCCLAGIPFLTGFYSKDLIIEVFYGSWISFLAYVLAVVSVLLTSLYSAKVIYFTFLSSFSGDIRSLRGVHENNNTIVIPLIILTVLSILVGFLLQFTILGDQLPILVPSFTKLLPLIITIGGLSLIFMIFSRLRKFWWVLKSTFIKKLMSFFSSAWYFDGVVFYLLIKPSVRWGLNTGYKLIDNQYLELLAPVGLSKNILNQSTNSTKYYSGYISLYILLLLLFILFFASQL